MDPNQQPGQFNPNQYDFITSPQKPKKKLFSGGSSKLVLIAVGLGVFTLVVLILAVIFGGGSGSDADQLLRVGRQQSEVMRVAAVGSDKAGRTTAKSHAKSVELTLSSQQQQLIRYMESSEGVTVNPNQLTPLGNAENDRLLESAASDGRFDDTFTTIMNETIAEYRQMIERTHQTLQKESSQALLNQYYEESELLIQ